MVWASGGKEYHHGGLTGVSRWAGVTGGFCGRALGVAVPVVPGTALLSSAGGGTAPSTGPAPPPLVRPAGWSGRDEVSGPAAEPPSRDVGAASPVGSMTVGAPW